MEGVVEDSSDVGVDAIEAGVVYYYLKTGEQVEAVKPSPKEEYWFAKRLKDEKLLILPIWGLVKNPEAYSEEVQMATKQRMEKRRKKKNI